MNKINWIPVKDRLPDTDCWVLVQDGYDRISTAVFRRKSHWNLKNEKIATFTKKTDADSEEVDKPIAWILLDDIQRYKTED